MRVSGAGRCPPGSANMPRLSQVTTRERSGQRPHPARGEPPPACRRRSPGRRRGPPGVACRPAAQHGAVGRPGRYRAGAVPQRRGAGGRPRPVRPGIRAVLGAGAGQVPAEREFHRPQAGRVRDHLQAGQSEPCGDGVQPLLGQRGAGPGEAIRRPGTARTRASASVSASARRPGGIHHRARRPGPALEGGRRGWCVRRACCGRSGPRRRPAPRRTGPGRPSRRTPR